MVTRVLVVQHGEKRRHRGDPGLTEVGRAQVARTAAWLAGHEAPVAVWSSPLRRAVETAVPIAAACGLDVDVDARLRERMNWADEGESLDDFLTDWARATSDRSYVPRSGDSSHASAERFLAALDELAARTGPEGTAVVVSHGGVTVDALRTLFGDGPLATVAGAGLVAEGLPPCAVTRLHRRGWTWALAAAPSTAHLDAAPTVCDADDGDARAIAALHAASWRATYRGLLPDGFLDGEADRDRARTWTGRFAARAGTLTLVARSHGELVGFAHSIVDDDRTWGTHLTNLHVAPGRTRTGIGRLLVHETARRLVDRARTPGLHLWVLAGNERARAFYERLGGRVTGSGTAVHGDTESPTVRYAWPDLHELVARTR